MTNVPKHFGGAGVDVFSWCLCDAPLLLLALLKAGVEYHEFIKQGVDHLVSLYCDNGFPCAVSPELGKFRGPGRKDDCCPYATLIMANLLSYIPEYRDSQVAVSSVKVLLSLWENSLGQHLYVFHFKGTVEYPSAKAKEIWFKAKFSSERVVYSGDWYYANFRLSEGARDIIRYDIGKDPAMNNLVEFYSSTTNGIAYPHDQIVYGYAMVGLDYLPLSD